MGQLYINEQLIDFSQRTVIGITKQINDIATLDKVKGESTNNFKLPKTKTNLQILGLPGDLNFSSGYEYQQLRAKYIEDGEEIIPNGLAEIKSVNEYIEIVVLSGNAEFFDLLEGSIRDLDLSAYNHIWDFEGVLNSLQNDSGYIYPIIDYGNLPADKREIDVQYLRPGIFIHSIIESIISKTGFTAKGDIFQDPDFVSELMPLPDNLKQPDGFDTSFYFQSLKTADQISYNAGGFFKISFPDTSNSAGNAGGYWDAANSRYVFIKGATVKFSGKFRVGGNNSNFQDFKIGFTKNADPGGVVYYAFFAQTTVQVKNRHDADVVVESDEVYFAPGDYVEVWAIRHEPGTSFAHKQFVRAGANITLTLGAATFGSEVSIQKSLPDISIKDFLKSWMYRYCLLVQTDNANKTVTFRSFDDVQKNIPKAKDWSDKIDEGEQDSVEFNIGSYAQQNWFRYKSDSNVTDSYGDGVILINDKTLDLTKDILTMPFAASLTTTKLIDIKTALIQKIDPTNTDTQGNVIPDFRISTEPRILRIYKHTFDVNDPVKFFHNGDQSELNENIPFAYFSLAGRNGLDFTDIIEKRYAQLKRTLNQTKKVTPKLLLNALDMADFDHFTPVFISKYGFYFYVNKVDSYIEGEKTKVELIRL